MQAPQRRGVLNKAAIVLGVAVAAGPCCVAAQERGGFTEELQTYMAIGRVKWRLPSDFEYYFAHPHGSMGPRIVCKGERYECEISVLNRELPRATADRQEQLRQAFLRDTFNTLPVTITSSGALKSVHYVALMDPNARFGRFGALGGGYRLMISGFAEKGPALISFNLYSNDTTAFAPLLNVIDQAEALDAVGVLAWRLGDLKAVCEERFPKYKAGNDSAFASSRFAAIDIPAAVKTALSLPASVDEVRSNLTKARTGFARSFDAETPERREAICSTFPWVLSQAMNGISATK